jgi:uncharacterized membrane protein YqiK
MPPQEGAAPPQSDPAQAVVAAEQIRATATAQAAQIRAQADIIKAQMQDDRERDKMVQELEIAMANIAGKYGIAIDTARIKAEQAASQPMQMMAQPMPQNNTGVL